MLGNHFVHQPQGDFVLTLGVLLKGPIDLDMDGPAAPLEFLAAAARTG